MRVINFIVSDGWCGDLEGEREGEKERDTNLPNPPYVLIPRLLIEPQVFIQPKTDVIAIEPVRELAEVEEVLFECDSDCGLQ